MNDEAIKIIAARLQDDCHKTVEAVCKANNKISVQDATNVWIFYRLAQLELLNGLLGEPIYPTESITTAGELPNN